MKLPPEVLAPIVNRVSLAHQLRPDIVMCIILQESQCDPFAWRHEEAWYERNMSHQTRESLSGWTPRQTELPSLYDEKLQRSCSFGLMQVLGDTARWCAKANYPFLTALCDPEIGVEVGCRILSYYLGLHKDDYQKAVAAYNAGDPNSSAGKAYAQKIFNRHQKGEHLKYLKGASNG